MSSGAKISKPEIFKKFYPLPFDEKYITVNTQGAMSAKNYKYFSEVLSIISPILKENNIHIIQLGRAKEQPLSDCFSLLGKTSIQQTAYLINNESCLLHLGVDSLLVHFASAFNKKLVGIYSVSPPEVCGPYFGNKENQVCIEPPFEGRTYAFNPGENPSPVNEIKPEEIANAVLKLLNLKPKEKIESYLFGEKYGGIIIETVPNQIINNNFFNNAVLYIRCDYLDKLTEEQEKNVYNQIALRKSVIYTDKSLNVDILKKLKPNLQQVVFEIKENNQNLNFVKQLHTAGIPYLLTTFLSNEKLQEIKLDYSDFNLILPQTKITKEKLLEKVKLKNLHIRSNKLVLSDNKIFFSKHHFCKNIPAKSMENNIVKIEEKDLTPEFLDDIMFMYFFSRHKI